MNLVFASDSIWNWDAEKNFAVLKEENPELVQAARRGSSVAEGAPMRRRSSGGSGDEKMKDKEDRRPSLIASKH